jgi:tetratricopeptide (TPR) repeat protein
LLFQKKDFSGAIAIFQDCIRDHPTYHDAYHGMAMALRDAGDPAKALPNHDRAIELSPQRADYYLVRGITCQRLKNHDAAIKTFELGLAAKDTRYCEPGFLQAALAKSLRARGELQKALTFNTQAIELNPENDWLYLERAYTYLAMGQTERADADFATSKEKLKKLK